MPDTRPEPIETRVAERFKLDTAKHQLAVLHEDGLYRHLRLQQPGTGHHWFDLITWPGALAIKGDMGSYTFSRSSDMLDFFRRSAYNGAPNLSYWEEKLDAADAHSGVRAYSEDLLRQYIADDLTACAEAASAAYMDGLREELDDELLGEYSGWFLGDEGDALAGVRQFSYRPDGEEPFSFDPTEWVVTEYAWHYMWCCHAIVWGIAAYDRAKAEQPAPLLAAAAVATVEG